MAKLPVFAPLTKDFTSALEPKLTAALRQEALELQEYSTEDLITYENNLSVHDSEKFTLTKHLRLEDYAVNHKLKSGQAIHGHYGSFRSLNLTYLPDFPDSKFKQFYIDEQQQTRAYLFVENPSWTWRKDLNMPHLASFVAQLGLKKIHLIRLIYLIPPAVGGVHIDASPYSMEKYYSQNGVSLTFNLLSGHGSLYFLRKDGVHRIPEHLIAWHFNPSIAHSVGQVPQARVQLRIFGELEAVDYLSLLDLTSAIW